MLLDPKLFHACCSRINTQSTTIEYACAWMAAVPTL